MLEYIALILVGWGIFGLFVIVNINSDPFYGLSILQSIFVGFLFGPGLWLFLVCFFITDILKKGFSQIWKIMGKM